MVGCAIEVHKHLGPGLLESVYQKCFIDELISKGLKVKSEVQLPVVYKGKDLGNLLRIDVLVEDIIIVELKAVEVMIHLFKAQLLSYLKLSGIPKGLLINFKCENISQQVVPMVTEKFATLPKE